MMRKPSIKTILIILLVALGVILALYLFSLSSQGEGTLRQPQNYPEISLIKGSNWDFQKLTEFFKDLAREKGGEYAYHTLASVANQGYLTANVDSHLLGHVVGDVLYKQKGIEGIKVCTDDLRNACSHSIVVGYLLDNGEESLPKAVATCRLAPGGSGAYTMCVHGLGHGVLGYTEYDMRRAVDLCTKTGTPEYNNREVGQCVGGVSMEMMAGIHDKEAWMKQKPNYFKENDPLAPCNMGFIPREALNFCYVYLTPHLFVSAGADLGHPDPKYFHKAMSYCENIPAGDPLRQTCFGSFGKEFVVLANQRNVESVVHMKDSKLLLVYDWCNMGPSEALSPCLDSALQSFYWGGENDPKVSIRFCSIIPDKTKGDECMKSLFKAVNYYIRGNIGYKEKFCGQVPNQYEEECRSLFLQRP